MEQESKELRNNQAQVDKMLASKVAAHIQPLQDEMQRTYKEQKMRSGMN